MQFLGRTYLLRLTGTGHLWTRNLWLSPSLNGTGIFISCLCFLVINHPFILSLSYLKLPFQSNRYSLACLSVPGFLRHFSVHFSCCFIDYSWFLSLVPYPSFVLFNLIHLSFSSLILLEFCLSLLFLFQMYFSCLCNPYLHRHLCYHHSHAAPIWKPGITSLETIIFLYLYLGLFPSHRKQMSFQVFTAFKHYLWISIIFVRSFNETLCSF